MQLPPPPTFTFLYGIIVVFFCSDASKCIEPCRDIPCSVGDFDLASSQGSELFCEKVSSN